MNEHASQIYFFQAQIQSKGIHPYHVGHAQPMNPFYISCETKIHDD